MCDKARKQVRIHSFLDIGNNIWTEDAVEERLVNITANQRCYTIVFLCEETLEMLINTEQYLPDLWI